jgi:type II secretory ATPase GspE/PulE/Tfp pilus assembly ATPase PilB-like protein
MAAFPLRIGTRAVDVRVSTLPSAHGERAVLRLLDKSDSKLNLEAVGMQGDVLARLEKLICPATRHHSGDRAYRLRQNHHAVCRAEPA